MDYELNPMIKLIKRMHNKFGIPCEKVKFSPEEKDFRVKCLCEEVQEYMEATTREDELDALVDLVVFALGTAERQNLLGSFEEAFERVMAANLNKEVGPNEKRDSFALDLVKPEGWQPADLSDLVRQQETGQMSLMEFLEEKDD